VHPRRAAECERADRSALTNLMHRPGLREACESAWMVELGTSNATAQAFPCRRGASSAAQESGVSLGTRRCSRRVWSGSICQRLRAIPAAALTPSVAPAEKPLALGEPFSTKAKLAGFRSRV